MRGSCQLRITGDQDTLQLIARKIDRILDKGWRRDHQQEFELESQADDGSNMYCFACHALGKRPASLLWIRDCRIGTLEISHIGPPQGDEPSRDEDDYDYACEEFYQRFVVPATRGMNVDVDFVQAALSLEDRMSVEAASLLRKLANATNSATNSATNKSSGAVQAWRDHWNTFFVAAHRENAALNGAVLRQFLMAETGWSEERASELQVQYETARSLLKYYDSAMFERSMAV